MPPGNLPDLVAFHPRARRLLARFRDPGRIAHRLPVPDLLAAAGLGPASAPEIVEARRDLRRRAERECKAAEKAGIRLVTREDPAYPPALLTLPFGPLLLYVRGSLPEPVLRVAVVGSRRATAYGRRVAAGLSGELARRGIEVVSGGARGVDTHAHLGALEAGGRTVTVLGSGLLRPYPEENRDLFTRIAASGAVLSEFPLETGPKSENFPRRNRLISGLAAAVVVVEAASRSGSLVTAAHALEQGREVMAVPGPVSSPQSRGCHRLIQQGAKLVHQVEDILEELSPMYLGVLRPVKERDGGPRVNLDGLSHDEAVVLGLLDDPEPVHVDRLADLAPFGIARLQAALFGLELRGAVEQMAGRYYVARLPEAGSVNPPGRAHGARETEAGSE